MYLVQMIQGLDLAAQKHPTERVDLLDLQRKLEVTVSELFASNFFDTPENAFRLIQPHYVRLGQNKFTLFKEGSVISYCLHNDIHVIFDNPRVNNITNMIFYEYDTDKKVIDNVHRVVYRYSLFAYCLSWILDKEVDELQLANKIDESALTFALKTYFRSLMFSHALKTIPFSIMVGECFSKICVLVLLAIVVFHSYAVVDTPAASDGGMVEGIVAAAAAAEEGQPLVLIPQDCMVEKMLVLITLADMMFEFGQLFEEDIIEWGSHFIDTWNFFDITCQLLIVSWMILRFLYSESYFTEARICLTLAAIPLSFGLLRYFSLYRPLGELLILLIRGMGRELFNFAAVYFMVSLGFGIGFFGLFS